MEEKKRPILRTVQKSEAPYPINQFPPKFPAELGKEIVYLLATKEVANLEGSDWEAIFARCIGAEWKPSNVGLDDVILGNTAWGAKSVKDKKPFTKKTVRLISGRNSISYSFGEKIDTNADPNEIGKMVLDIWNERVSSVREKFKNLRTIVLIKGPALTELVIFELDTIRYDPELFQWHWNKKTNLEGWTITDKKHKFTWQHSGSQFTIIENVPPKTLKIRLQSPQKLEKEAILSAINFNPSWVQIVP